MSDSHTLPEVLTRGVAEILPNAQSLAKLMAERPITVYLGIDPTGSLLTLGHSVVLRKLQQFADLGHTVILLIGNGTVRIGDPTGRDTTRPVLTDEEINTNFKTWKEQASKVLNFNTIEIRYNGDWLDKLTYADLVKLLAKTTVQQLLERDMFQDRLKNNLPIYGHEIIYPLLQGYDSVAMNVDLELGGTDQTFNMMMGRQLQKSYNDHEKWVLSTPIINGTDGRKMSKTFNNFVALNDNPQTMYGKLMSIADDMIINYFTVLTDVPMREIEEMQKAMKDGKNPLGFKKMLAKTITTDYHDAEAAEAAEANFEKTVQRKEIPSSVPVVTVPAQQLTLISLASLAQPNQSNSDLRRLISQGGVKYNNETVTNPLKIITPQKGDILKQGKRSYFQIALAEK